MTLTLRSPHRKKELSNLTVLEEIIDRCVAARRLVVQRDLYCADLKRFLGGLREARLPVSINETAYRGGANVGV